MTPEQKAQNIEYLQGEIKAWNDRIAHLYKQAETIQKDIERRIEDSRLLADDTDKMRSTVASLKAWLNELIV